MDITDFLNAKLFSSLVWLNKYIFSEKEECINNRVMNIVQTEKINRTEQVCICLGVKALEQILHLICVCEGNVTMLLLLLFIPCVIER